MKTSIVFLGLLLTSCTDFSGAELVKICRDGTYIYKLPDNTYVTGMRGGNTFVPGPQVCE